MPRRGRECRRAGLESPECAKGLGNRGTPPPTPAPTVLAPGCRSRPRAARAGRGEGLRRRDERPASLVHVPQPLPQRRVRMCLPPPCPGPTGGTAASPQPPGPRFHQCHPACRRSAPDANLLECSGGEARRSSQVPAALDPSPLPHVVPARWVNCPTLFTDGLICQ